jgi:hypothetical protein
MEKRDLKADLEAIRKGATLFGDPNSGVNTQCELYEIVEHAIERAMKAEARVQRLLDVLGRVIPSYLVGRLELMDSVPEATVVRGEWKLYGNDDDSGMSYWCTVCNFQLSEDLFYSGYKNGRWIENGVFKYCPNCGAKMEVEP